MTSRRRIVWGLVLLAVPHFLYELRVSLISAAQVVPPLDTGVVPVEAYAWEPVLGMTGWLRSLPLVALSVGLFAGLALLGARLFTSGIRPPELEVKPWPESVSDFSFAIAAVFHSMLLGSWAPWLQSGGSMAWAMLPGALAGLGVWMALKPPKESVFVRPLPLPLLVLAGSALSLGVLMLLTSGHVAAHQASRLDLVSRPGAPFWGPVLERSLMLVLWTTGLFLFVWRLAVRDWRQPALALLPVIAAGGMSQAQGARAPLPAESGPRQFMAGVPLETAGSPTLVILHDEHDEQGEPASDQQKKRLTPRMLPEQVWSTIEGMPVRPLSFGRWDRRIAIAPELKPYVDDIHAASGVAAALPEEITAGLVQGCFGLKRPPACTLLLDRLGRGMRDRDNDGLLYAFLDPAKFRLTPEAKSAVERAFARQGEDGAATITMKAGVLGAEALRLVLLSLEPGETLPRPEATSPEWTAFLIPRLVAASKPRADFADPFVFENVPEGNYLVAVVLRGKRQRYLIEEGTPIGPFEVGPGAVHLPAVTLGIRGLAGTVGIPVLGP